jgi:hypothetical protein
MASHRMSAEITIFLPALPKRGWFRRRAWTCTQLNEQIAADGFDMKLDDFDPEKQAGYVICRIESTRSGFEYYADSIDAYREAVEEMRGDDDFPYSGDDLSLIEHSASVVQLSIHWRPYENAAAAIAAACLARMTGGTVLDEPPWKWYSGDAAREWARDVLTRHRED